MMYEEQLRDPIISLLSEAGFKVYDQLPLFNGKIDFVGINDQNQCIVIEAKISKWKDAFKQALNYGYGADYVYIAMPNKIAHYVSDNYYDMFNQYRVGIISIKDGGAEILISSFKPEHSQVIKSKIIDNTNLRISNSEKRIKDFKMRFNI